MPGFDGTGPRGMGPMTGGARGMCNPYGYGGGFGFGRGRGYGLGRGAGWGRGFGWGGNYPGGGAWTGYSVPWGPASYGDPAYAGAMPYGGAPAEAVPYPGVSPYAPQMSREEELEFLKGQAQGIKAQLEQIGGRIKELEGEEERRSL